MSGLRTRGGSGRLRGVDDDGYCYHTRLPNAISIVDADLILEDAFTDEGSCAPCASSEKQHCRPCSATATFLDIPISGHQLNIVRPLRATKAFPGSPIP